MKTEGKKSQNFKRTATLQYRIGFEIDIIVKMEKFKTKTIKERLSEKKERKKVEFDFSLILDGLFFCLVSNSNAEPTKMLC